MFGYPTDPLHAGILVGQVRLAAIHGLTPSGDASMFMISRIIVSF